MFLFRDERSRAAKCKVFDRDSLEGPTSSAEELVQPHTPEHDEFTSLALRLNAGSGPLMATELYKRFDEAGRRILVETVRDAIERRV